MESPCNRHAYGAVALVAIAAVMCLVVIALRGPGQFTALSPGRLAAIFVSSCVANAPGCGTVEIWAAASDPYGSYETVGAIRPPPASPAGP